MLERLMSRLSARQSKEQTIKSSNRCSNKRHQYIIACATLTFVLTIQVLVFGLVMLYSIDDTKQLVHDKVTTIEEERFNFVWGVIIEACRSANIQAESIRDDLLDSMLTTYDTPERMDELKLELENPTSTSNVSNLFKQAISKQYMYYDTNFNDAFISVSYDITDSGTYPSGYMAATNNGAFITMPNGNEEVRQFSTIIENSYNPGVAIDTIGRTLSGYTGNDLIFMQVRSESTDVIVRNMTKQAVYEAYLIAGIAIFDTLVFSSSSYINNRDDIFGIPDMTASGSLVNNHKIIVTQQFKVSDMLGSNHSAQMHGYTLRIQDALDNGVGVIAYKQAVIIVLIIFWLVFVTVIIIIQNNLAQRLELDYLKALSRRAEQTTGDKSPQV